MFENISDVYEVHCSFADCDEQYSHALGRRGDKYVYACENCLREVLWRSTFVFPEELIIAYVRGDSVDDAEDTYRMTQEEAKRRRRQTPGWVYYIEVAGLIKIGFTTDLRSRLDSYPPNMKVLAVHPGTPEVETRMHRKFRMSLTRGREWFNPCLAIKEHTDKVRKDYGSLEDQVPNIFKYGRRWDCAA